MTAEPTFTCATCDVTITHHPTFHVGLAFCCAGCAADGPCGCSYDQDASQPIAACVAAPAAIVERTPDTAPADRPAVPTRLPRPVPAPAGSAAPALSAARR